MGRMRRMLLRGTAVALSAAVLAAGALASCSMGGDPGRGMQGAGDEDQNAGPGENPDGGPGDGTDTGSGVDMTEAAPGVDITDCPYLKIEKRGTTYVVSGIYENELPDDGSIVIPDGVGLGDTWCDLYDESDEYLGHSLEASDVNSISLPAKLWMDDNITKLEGWNTGAWDVNNRNCIDIIYRGNLADWCTYLDLSSAKFFYTVRSIKIGKQEADLKDLKKITAENIAGAKRIGGYAFYKCSGLTSVEIPDSVTGIGDYAFYECSGLTSVEIPDSVWEIGDYAFSGCSGLTSVEIPDRVGEIGEGAFYKCSGLTSVTIGNGVWEIGDYAFSSCSGLTSVTIGNSVTKIGLYAFSSCSGLTSVEIPDSVTEIVSYAFHGCSGLTSVTIGNSVTEIGSCAFAICTGLTEVEIPDSVTKIGSYAFDGCEGLSSVTFGEPDGWYCIRISSSNKFTADFDNGDPKGNRDKLVELWRNYAFVRDPE